MYKKEKFGQMPDKRIVERYTLMNKNGVSASFLTLGGIWASMVVPDKEGRRADVVLGYSTVADYMRNGAHLGEIVGRNANRIGGAAFTLGGECYNLDANDGPNNLHSGYDFYRNRLWDAEVSETEGGSSITFSLESPEGDQGYPGNAKIAVTYTLTADNAVRIDYHMICDCDTVANMTNHSYFNLAGHGSGDATAQKVWIDADYYTPMTSGSIPTGELAPVKASPMDFTGEKSIAHDIGADFEQLKFGGGYDHNWVLNHARGELSLAVTAFDGESGRKLEVYTDLPGVQFYTGNYLDGDIPGKDGASYGFRHGYCFETQYYPNAVNVPEFPSPVLREGEEYKTTTIYKFVV